MPKKNYCFFGLATKFFLPKPRSSTTSGFAFLVSRIQPNNSCSSVDEKVEREIVSC